MFAQKRAGDVLIMTDKVKSKLWSVECQNVLVIEI